MPAAASFKHVSPAGAAVAKPMSDTLKKIYFVDDLELSPIATAYARARGADRMSSYGDWAALSDVCDNETATLLASVKFPTASLHRATRTKRLRFLKTKRKGTYNVVEIDPDYKPEPIEHKDVFGITFEQGRNELKIDADMLANRCDGKQRDPGGRKARPGTLPHHTEIHAVELRLLCEGRSGHRHWRRSAEPHPLHASCGQQGGHLVSAPAREGARICRLRRTSAVLTATTPSTCTSLTTSMTTCCATAFGSSFSPRSRRCSPARRKQLGLRTLTGVSVGSATRSSRSATTLSAHTSSGVEFIAQPGGSIRDDNVIDTCNKYGIAMAFTGIRLFHH